MLSLFNGSYRVQHLTVIYNQRITLYETIKFTKIYCFKLTDFEFPYDVLESMSAL